MDENGKKQITSGTNLEGWTFRVGVYNNTYVTCTPNKVYSGQSGTAKWIEVDETSKFTFSSLGDAQFDNSLELHTSASEGIVFPAYAKSGQTLQYYLTGSGSVKFNGAVTAGTHTIYAADATLTSSEGAGYKTVQKKTLVSFTSSDSTPTFTTGSATVTIKDSTGAALANPAKRTAVPAADLPIGTYAIIQESNGVYLYYVDYSTTASESDLNVATISGSGETWHSGLSFTSNGVSVAYSAVAGNKMQLNVSGTPTYANNNSFSMAIFAPVNASGDTLKLTTGTGCTISEALFGLPTTITSDSVGLTAFSCYGNGSLTFDGSANSITLGNTNKGAVKSTTSKVTFKGSGDNGVTLNYGTSNDGALLNGHLIFDGGTHSLTTGGGSNFANATADNPTILVKNGTTLNLTGKDLGGWSGNVDIGGIIEVATGGKLNFCQSGSETLYYRQRLTIDPGAEVSVNFSNNSQSGAPFRLQGGVTDGKEQIYVPASVAGSDEAKITVGTGSYSSIRMASDGTRGFGIFVGENSTLSIANDITSYDNNCPIKKNGDGTLKLSGALSGMTGTITQNGGNMVVTSAGTVAPPWTISAGTLEFTPASDATMKVAGIISGSSGTLKLSGGTVNLTATNTFSGTYNLTANTIKLNSGALPLGKAFNTALTSKIIAESGDGNVFKYGRGNYGAFFCSTDSKDDPILTVKDGATLTFYMKDTSGWTGDVSEHSWTKVENGATLNIEEYDDSSSRYFRDHLLLVPGSTVTLNGTHNALKVFGGAAGADKAQIYVPAGSGDVTFNGEGTLELDGTGSNDATKGCGVMVGSGATLKISNTVTESNGFTKYGDGTLMLTNNASTYSGTVTLYGGVVKSVKTLTTACPSTMEIATTTETIDSVEYNVYTVSTKTYTVTVPVVTHATVTVTIDGGDPIDPTSTTDTTKTYTVNAGTTVVVTYTADEGYELDKTTPITYTSISGNQTVSDEQKPTASEKATIDFSGVKAIVGRLAGGYNGAADAGADSTKAEAAMALFDFQYDSTLGTGVTVGPNSDGSKILIKAATVDAASFGLGKYIRNTAKGHISWCGNRAPTEWKIPTETMTYTPPVSMRMAYNYCTISYTMGFWNKSQWREEIDRIALNGFNTALVLHGLSKVWKETLTDMGYTTDEIQAFIPDACTWAWWNMGNIEGIGGPVSDAQIEQDAATAKWMYAEMKKVGIEPLLQAFVGLVPSNSARALAAKYSDNTDNANYILLGQGNYQGLTRPYVLYGANVNSSSSGDDYSCPAFDAYAASWYKHLKEVYGMDTAGDVKYLGGDLFHEGGSTSGVGVSRFAHKIQLVQQSYFSGVKWILQHWGTNPSQAFVNNLDVSQTIIERLDNDMSGSGASNSGWTNSSSEKFPWIWCEVMNFGGNTGMYGGLTCFRNITKIGVSDTAFLGWGLLSEGLETNPLVYDTMLEQMYEASDDSMSDDEFSTFLSSYIERRYGATSDDAKSAMEILASTVLKTKRAQQGTLETVFCANPAKRSLPITQVSQWGPSGDIEYTPSDLYPAARTYLALAQSASFKDLETFKYDYVELFLQLLSDRGREITGKLATSQSTRDEFRQLLDLAERLTASSDRWRLDWHEARCNDNADNATNSYRRMLTTWVENDNRGSNTLPEYAHRAYAGLLKDYYGKRWNYFLDYKDGTISQAQFTSKVSDLDSTFTTAELTSTAATSLVDIGNEILLLLDPPTYNWSNDTEDGKWNKTSANWTMNGNNVLWTDGHNASFTAGDATTITVEEAVSAVDVTIEAGTSTYTDVTGENATSVIDATTPTVIFSNTSLSDLLDWSFTATMGGGGWIGTAYTATGYGVTPVISNGELVAITVQFQCVDGTWLKVENVKFTQSGDDVVAIATAVYCSSSASMLGTVLTSNVGLNSSAPSVSNYPLKAIVGKKPTTVASVTLDGPATVTGTLALNGKLIVPNAATLSSVTELTMNGGSLDLAVPAGTSVTVPTLSVESGLNTILLTSGTEAAPSTLTLNALEFGSRATLLIKGTDEVLTGTSPCRVRVISASGAVSPLATAPVYVSTTSGAVTTLRVDENGYLVPSLKELTYEPAITTEAASTGWKNVALADLATYQFVSGSTTATNITLSADSLTMMVGETTVTLTLDDNGIVLIQADATGLTGLTATPGVARVTETGANYATFQAAMDVAKTLTDKGVVIYGNVSYGTKQGITGGVVVTIDEGASLTATLNDAVDYNGTATIIVKGTLNMSSYRWTLSSNNNLTIYGGAKIVGDGDSDGALDIFNSAHTVNVTKNGDETEAVVTAPIRLRHDITFNVDADVTITVTDFTTGDTGNKSIIKSGEGTLIFVGEKVSGQAVKLTAGTLERELEPEEVFTMTVTGGTPEITSSDSDYEIVETTSGNDHTYTSTAIPWVFYVTPAGATSDTAAGGTKCRNLSDALIARRTFMTADPTGGEVKFWVIRGASATLPTGYTINDGADGSEVVPPASADYVYWNTKYNVWRDASDSQSGGNYGKANYISPDGSITNEVTILSTDTMVFDTSFTTPGDNGKVLYLYNDTSMNGAQNTKKAIVKSGVTLHLGFSESRCDLPNNFNLTVEEGATVVLSVWTNGTKKDIALGSGVTIEGAGTVAIDSDRATSVAISTATIKTAITQNGISFKLSASDSALTAASDALTVTSGATGYAVSASTTEGVTTYSLVSTENIEAQIGYTSYATLSAAVAAAKAGDTITILKKLDETAVTISAGTDAQPIEITEAADYLTNVTFTVAADAVMKFTMNNSVNRTLKVNGADDTRAAKLIINTTGQHRIHARIQLQKPDAGHPE